MRGIRWARFALMALAAGEISAAAAGVLVLRSDGASAGRHYPAGQRYADDQVFHLRPGDSLSGRAALPGEAFRQFVYRHFKRFDQGRSR